MSVATEHPRLVASVAASVRARGAWAFAFGLAGLVASPSDPGTVARAIAAYVLLDTVHWFRAQAHAITSGRASRLSLAVTVVCVGFALVGNVRVAPSAHTLLGSLALTVGCLELAMGTATSDGVLEQVLLRVVALVSIGFGFALQRNAWSVERIVTIGSRVAIANGVLLWIAARATLAAPWANRSNLSMATSSVRASRASAAAPTIRTASACDSSAKATRS